MILIALLCTPQVSFAQEVEPEVEQAVTAYYSETGTELAQLVAGEAGEGLILYYLPERGIERPSLVVRLSKQADAEVALAEVFDAPADLDYVPVQIEADRTFLDRSLTSVITIQALDGWWKRGEFVNYNLDIEIRGPIAAMWGTSYELEPTSEGWPTFVERGQLAVRITTRDPEQEGRAKWDLRLLEPEFRDRGYFRSTYAERKCESPTEIDLGVSPLWPYVAYEGEYELETGQQRPPIVVDWNQARIIYFSEIVTVRNQNCSYSFNAVNRLTLGELNKANYETPLAFYDLSEQGTGFPNLLLRAERYPAKDPWIGGLEKDLQMIRYSWRTEVGDKRWDYKVEVLGFHPYSDTTAIADGLLTIDAPAYEEFPEWVLQKKWPVVTFIDSEGKSYESNEGLYEWSPREVGIGYALGWQETHASDAFARIRPGLRGEYRFRKNLPATLYLSPIDNRLHLLGAEGGLWHINDQFVLRSQNLDDDLYLDGWIRNAISGENDQSPSAGTPPESPQLLLQSDNVEEMLYALEGHLLYSGFDEVILRQATYDAMIELLPPKDASTWRAFNQQVKPTTSAKRDPLDFKSWLDAFDGDSVVLKKAQISQIRAIEKGFRFVLDLQPGFTVTESDLFDSTPLEAGTYLIKYDGQWTVEPLTLPELAINIQLPQEEDELSILNEILLQAIVKNSGLTDVKGVQLVGVMINEDARSGVSETWPITKQKMDLLSDEMLSIPLNLHPKSAGEWMLRFWVEDEAKKILVETSQRITIPPQNESSSLTIFSLSTGVWKQSLSLLLLLAFAISMIYALFIGTQRR